MNKIKKITCIGLSFLMFLSSPVHAKKAEVEEIVSILAKNLISKVTEAKVGTVGGEWLILGLSRSDYNISDEYFEKYYKNVEEYLANKKGKLHDKKYSEYSRVILALTAIGKDPRDVAGYNLIKPLGDFEKTKWQGINGSIFALIALDSNNYEIPKNEDATVQATREMYLEEILKNQLIDGGFALSGTKADADITAMAIQALSKYQDIKLVKESTNKALDALSNSQDDSGGFSSWGVQTAESTAQVLVAIMELGIDINDKRFVKNGNTVLDNFLTYYKKGEGFKHDLLSKEIDLMPTEQALFALTGYLRIENNKTSLYDMTDINPVEEIIDNNKEELINIPSKKEDKTFKDIKNHKNKEAIEFLASRGIINGINEDEFKPDSFITRAEFATIVVIGLGLTEEAEITFLDIDAAAWYKKYIAIAYKYGLISGKTQDSFEPEANISREEAAVLIERVAKLAGLNTMLDDKEIKDTLSSFSDYMNVSSWAKNALAFSYSKGILPEDDSKIRAKEYASRGEIAEMFFQFISRYLI